MKTTNRRELLRSVSSAAVVSVFGLRSVRAADRVAVTANVQSEAREVGRQLVKSSSPDLSSIDRLVAKTSDANKADVLFFVFRESIELESRDKQALLTKLKRHNQLAKQLAAYISQLNSALESKEKKEKLHSECTAKEAAGLAAKLERAAKQVEEQIANLNPKDKTSRDIQHLLSHVQRDRIVLAKARQSYKD